MSDKATVCVTGVTGYLATEIAHQLLSRGYIVHGTVRSLVSESAKDFHSILPGVKLFEADLLKEGSFEKAFEDCTAVIHAASPFVLSAPDPQKDLIEPALNGTKNVLESILHHKSVKSVVVTSSLAACVEHYPTDDGTKVWTEEDWNTTSTVSDGPYRLSKTLAEKYALEWGEKHPDVKVCTILPTFIIGPPLTKRADATSIKFFKDLLDGTWEKTGAPAASSGMVDVRDVALAHILAIEIPQAKGRYLVTSEEGIPRLEAARIIKKEFPNYPVPEKQNGELLYRHGNLLPTGKYSVAKAQKDLGIQFRSVPASLVETVHKLIELGVIPKNH